MPKPERRTTSSPRRAGAERAGAAARPPLSPGAYRGLFKSHPSILREARALISQNCQNNGQTVSKTTLNCFRPPARPPPYLREQPPPQPPSIDSVVFRLSSSQNCVQTPDPLRADAGAGARLES